MKSDMNESISSLVFLEYPPYIKLMHEIVQQQQSLFTIVSKQVLQVATAQVAQQVVQQVNVRKKTRKELPPLFPYTLGTRAATVHLDGEQAVNEMIKAVETLRTTIRTQLASAITQSTLPVGTPDAYIQGLSFAISTIQGNAPKGLHYPFETPQKLNKRRIHVRSQASQPAASSLRYRGHKLTITLEGIGNFDSDLIDGFETLLQGLGATANETTEVRAFLQNSKQDPTSELARLKKLMKEETLGKVKVETSWRFWTRTIEAITKVHQHASNVSADEQAGRIEMQRQLRLLTRFRNMLQDATKPDTDFQVNYADESFNVRTLFARADAYDVLPIFPEMVGTLGEVQDQIKDEQTFTYGIRFKLNGPVGSVDSTFQYYATLLDPLSSIHKERLTDPLWNKRRFTEEVIQIAILYLVLFRLADDDTFEHYLHEFLVHLSTDGPQEKEVLLHGLSQRLLQRQGVAYRYEQPLEQARGVLEAFFQRASSEIDTTPMFSYLILQNGMLRLNLNRILTQKRFFLQDLFTGEEHRKDALRYITLQDSIPQQDAFYAVPLQLSLEPIYLSEAQDGNIEEATTVYDITNWQMLPVMFVPDTPTSRATVDKAYALYRRVMIPYLEDTSFRPDSSETALYRHAFLFLTYICLDILWSISIRALVDQKKRLFLPLIRVHEREQETGRGQSRFPNEEKVMRGMTKTLAHILSCERSTLSNAQGFSLEAVRGDTYKMSNGLSSLYNLLPRIIIRPATAPNALDKLAMIVISSRMSDAHAASTFQRMCVYGEIIGCTRLSNGNLRVEQLSTFSVNEDSNNLYTTPRTLLDAVRRCAAAGFHDIFYIAKAPYSSHVHFTGKEESDELFFMSPNIIGGVLEAFSDVRLYPMFCDRYYVAKIKKNDPESLYVDDTKELRTLMADPNKSTVVFFNVMNGFHVQPPKSQRNQKRHHYYHGVVSYATLINMYSNPLYDQAIRNNLLDSSQPGSLRPDMLDALAYVHGVRYERRDTKGIQLKLDPYESIIGFDSVGARALLPSLDFRVRSNTLAFLTLVRGMLRRKKDTQTTTPPSSTNGLSAQEDRGANDAE